jgi:hypothetical protein
MGTRVVAVELSLMRSASRGRNPRRAEKSLMRSASRGSLATSGRRKKGQRRAGQASVKVESIRDQDVTVTWVTELPLAYPASC